MKIETYSISRLPSDVRNFWTERIAGQEHMEALTRSLDWYEMMTGQDPADQNIFVVREDNGGIHAILPLFKYGYGIELLLLGFRVKADDLAIFKFSGGSPIASSSINAQQYAAAVNRIFDENPSIDAIYFDRVVSDNDIRLLRESSKLAGKYFIIPSPSIPLYRIKMQDSFEEITGSRSKESIEKIFGRERALSRHLAKECRTIEIKSAEDVRKYSGDIQAVMEKSWQSKRWGAYFDVSQAISIAQKGWLRSFMLMCGDLPIAFVLGYQGYNTFIYEKIGYSQEFSKYSPGTILLYRLLEKVYKEERPAYFDFGEGDAYYKKVLANDIQECRNVLVVRKQNHALLLKVRYILCVLDRKARGLADRMGLYKILRRRVRK